MEKIPTAEEFSNDIKYVTHSLDEKLITFAKLHVEAALKAASESTLLYDFTEEITNSYPLENIK